VANYFLAPDKMLGSLSYCLDGVNMDRMHRLIVTVMPLNTAIIIPCSDPANNHGSIAVKNTSK